MHALAFARGVFNSSLHRGLTLLIPLITALVILEAIRYFSPFTRTSLLVGLISIVFISVALLILLRSKLAAQKFSQSSDQELARRIGEADSDSKDRLMNAVQLSVQESPPGTSAALKELAIERAESILNDIPDDILYPDESVAKLKKRLTWVSGISLLLILISLPASFQSLTRWMQPGREFTYLKPSALTISVNQEKLLVGDTLTLKGKLEGRQTAQVRLYQQGLTDSSVYELEVQDSSFRHVLPAVEESMTLTAQITNRRFWEPWRTLNSAALNVQVINRPVLQDLSLTIKAPGYTRLPVDVLRRDILDVSVYPGSRVIVNGLVSKEIEEAKLKFEHAPDLDLEVKGNRISAQFTATVEDRFHFHLKDAEGVRNLDPLSYPLYLRTDVPPLAKFLLPAQDVILGESLILPLRYKLDDDFGFSRLELQYQREASDFFMVDTSIQILELDLSARNQPTLEDNYTWDLDDLNLAPEDGLVYWLRVYDNNVYSGPQWSESRRWSVRLPSLEEMFAEIDEGHEQIDREASEVLDIVKEIKEKVDQLALEVQKDPNLNWEQQQEAEAAIEQVQDLKQQLESISEELDKMMQAAEEQQLFSDETMGMYSELQNLFEELLTPELMEAMQRLQEAMQEQDPQQMQMALEDFQSSMENFEQSVERTMEILKQVQLEQKIDELNARLSDLADRQSELMDELGSMDAAEAATREEQISEDFDAAQQTAEELQELLNERDDLNTSPVDDIRDQMDQQEISENLQQASEAMRQSQMQQAMQPGNQAMQSLQQLSQSAMQMQSALQQQMMDNVMSEFRRVMLKALALSQEQEGLEEETAGTPRHSSMIREQADDQQMLQGGLQQVARDLNALGKKTFAVTGGMSKSLGKVQSSMSESIRELEARNPRKASEAQSEARTELNRMARQLASAMQNLQQSGQSSGFEQYMEQLQQMTGGQQGLNQETLLQMGMGRQSMMQQLAQRQLQLREALRQIEEGMGSDGRMLGDLGKIGDEMEAVAKELQSRRPSDRVVQQQERILSRLLDAQRSAHQRDYSKKRTSESAELDPLWLGVDGLPEDLGEGRNLLYEEVLRSLQQNYSREEQALIRQYFEQLEGAIQ